MQIYFNTPHTHKYNTNPMSKNTLAKSNLPEKNMVSFSASKSYPASPNMKKAACAVITAAGLALTSLITTPKQFANSDRIKTETQLKNNETAQNTNTTRLKEDEKKILLARQMLDTINKDYKEIINSLWEISLITTKDKDTEASSIRPLIAPIYDDKTHDWKESGYQNIIRITRGEKIWQEAKTADDAANMIRNTLLEANRAFNSSSFQDAFTSSAIINTGEYRAITMLLCGLANVNEQTKAVSEIYKEEIDFAREKTAQDLDKDTIFEKSSMADADDITLDNFDTIKEKYSRLKSLKLEYAKLIKQYETRADDDILSKITKIYCNYDDEYKILNNLNHYKIKSENSPAAIFQNRMREAVRYAERRLSYEKI